MRCRAPEARSIISGSRLPDIDAKFKELEANGVKVVTPVRDLPGIFKIGFVEDPWGTRIEIVQDPELLGLHHIHMRGPDTEAVFTWLLAKFGGQRTPLKGKLDAIKYSAPGFSDMWILVQRGETTPSEGHAIDHIGWRSTGPLADTINGLRTKSVQVTTRAPPASAAQRPDDQLLLRRRSCRREDRARRTPRPQAGRMNRPGFDGRQCGDAESLVYLDRMTRPMTCDGYPDTTISTESIRTGWF